MRLTVFRPSRILDGKRVVSRYYVGRYSLSHGGKTLRVSLHTLDKAIAMKRLHDHVLELQREEAGFVPARVTQAAALRPIAGHIEDYAADLKAQERAGQHIKDTRRRIERVFRELAWGCLADVTATAFIDWRARLSVSAKTKKEYLVSLTAFFNWLVLQKKLARNPLAEVPQVETRGKETRKSRAYSTEELTRLFAVSGPRAVVYRTLLYTGQRKKEVEALRWRDVHLDGDQPFAFFRAETMKDKEDRAIPLPLPLAAELLALRPPGVDLDARVFFGIFPHFETFTADLRRAGIRQRDSAGHVVNIHAFRKTHATMASEFGVVQKVTQTVLGHSDPNLTANIYTQSKR